jgi:hypothetical protein
MSFIANKHYHQLLGPDWEEDTLWGIKLHPSGEWNVFNYTMQLRDETDIRRMTNSMSIYILLGIIQGYIFLINSIQALKLVLARPRIMVAWCCLIQASMGLVYSISILLTCLPSPVTCRHVVWISGIGTNVSGICTGLILLQKLYLVYRCNAKLRICGFILLLPQIFVTYAFLSMPVIISSRTGCLPIHSWQLPWVKTVLETPSNILFSVAFFIAVRRYYKKSGTTEWNRLGRKSLRIMCLILTSNILCMFAFAFELAGTYSNFFLGIDWIFSSTLLVRHCSGSRHSSQYSDRYESL